MITLVIMINLGLAANQCGQPEVNHNYQRDHRLNLWFVVAANDRPSVEDVLSRIEGLSGIKVLDLPMVKDFHIDLGFGLQWN